MVDVTVINDPGGPSETTATLLNGYRFVDEDVVVSLPTVFVDQGAILDVPLSISNVDGLLAADVVISFDSAVLSAQSARTGALTSGWSIAADTGTPGTVVLSLASATAVSGSGVMANITVEVVGAPTSQTDLTVDIALLNDGAVTSDFSNGLFTVNGLFALSGTVNYFAGGAVPGVTMSLVGAGVHEETTDASGDFAFSDIHTGAYVLTPDKGDDVDEITAYDASLVLQAAAGLLNLSSEERLAADVNRNNSVTSMDASYILQKSVDLIGTPFPGAGRVWDFVPDSRSYALINDNLTAQDFTAILIGDVSGNWQTPPQGSLVAAGMSGSLEHDSSNTVTLALPEVEGSTGQQVQMPLEIDLGDETILSANLVLTFDPAELSVEQVAPGSTIDGMSLVANPNEPGVIRIGLTGAHPLRENGVLLQIPFTVVGTLESPSPVFIESAELDEGAVSVELQHGAVSLIAAEVVDRHIFYNNSYFDGFEPAADANDDNAIAPNPASASHPALGKTALLPGGSAAFQNYTSYSGGINGIMVDVASLADVGGLSDADFEFHVSNRNNRPTNNTRDPSTWAVAPTPAITVREDAGTGGSDRVTLIWDDHAIENQWLQVTVKATPATGLNQDDTFYFGNAVGECGDATAFTFVDGADFAGARDNTHDADDRAPVDDRFDYNRDSLVDATDLAIVRGNHTSFRTCLTLFPVPSLASSPSSSPSNSSSSPISEGTTTVRQLLLERSLADHELAASAAVCGSDWPSRCLVDRPYLRPRARQPADMPQQRTEESDPQTVSAIFQNLEIDDRRFASNSELRTTGDRWPSAVDDHFLNDDGDLLTW